ncbi:hypothetical protein Taro_037354 [Colocasia esculenta]|uniref:Uncharacterized protein n=1 Tax=Colocasia esculenta TaxID=4460 RepID=A0A843W0A0_COLES|nr:hypothetical protein [Colocasia esculenta]
MAAERAQLRDMQQTIQQLTQALLQAVGANEDEERGLRTRSKERKGLEQGGSLFFFVINPRLS